MEDSSIDIFLFPTKSNIKYEIFYVSLTRKGPALWGSGRQDLRLEVHPRPDLSGHSRALEPPPVCQYSLAPSLVFISNVEITTSWQNSGHKVHCRIKARVTEKYYISYTIVICNILHVAYTYVLYYIYYILYLPIFNISSNTSSTYLIKNSFSSII